MRPRSLRPALESLEGRLALSATTGLAPHGAHVARRSPPEETGPTFTLADLQAFSIAYLSTAGSGFYNPAYDFNHNGFIGHDDARYLARHERRLTPNIPLSVDVHLAPGQQVAHPGAHNSGGITRLSTVKIVGRTTPGSIVLTDNSSANFAFNGKALPTDAKGNFSYTLKLNEDLTNTEYLVFDPFGHQTIRSFPVLRLER